MSASPLSALTHDFRFSVLGPVSQYITPRYRGQRVDRHWEQNPLTILRGRRTEHIHMSVLPTFGCRPIASTGA